jgi:CheY-like chemotaxis protein
MMQLRMALRPQSSAVLVVEDDDDLGEAISDVISSLGFRPIWARNGQQAIAALQREQPAVMLVDLFMPGMSGSELLALVRRSPEWSQIPRVVMTGANDPMVGVREDAAVLYKPLDLDALTRLLESYCLQPPPAQP